MDAKDRKQPAGINSIWHYRLFIEKPCHFCVMNHLFLYFTHRSTAFFNSDIPDSSLKVHYVILKIPSSQMIYRSKSVTILRW